MLFHWIVILYYGWSYWKVFALTPIPVPTKVPTRVPTFSPSAIPTLIPTPMPTKNPYVKSKSPSVSPSALPTSRPTITDDPTPLPSSRPTGSPSSQPTRQPSRQPTSQPSSQPSGQPTTQPSNPTSYPSAEPTSFKWPTSRPTHHTHLPTVSSKPSALPTRRPTARPTSQPTSQPSAQPISRPTSQPTVPTSQPSGQPSSQPSGQPSIRPTSQPSSQPTNPTGQPSSRPSSQPISHPTNYPTSQPTSTPSAQPLSRPTSMPTKWHTWAPSSQPTSQPTGRPSQQPTSIPTHSPTFTKHPTNMPTDRPSSMPSSQPSTQPTCRPTAQPSSQPTNPTGQPTSRPTHRPSTQPSSRPSGQPTSQPSRRPTGQPSSQPSTPTGQPSGSPTNFPTSTPTSAPTYSKSPVFAPTSQPTYISKRPTSQPTSTPSMSPTLTYRPTVRPTSRPTSRPTAYPTFEGGFGKTARPTAYYIAATISGSVVFTPDDAQPCTPLELSLYINFGRDLRIGSTFTVNTPGMTSGPCYEASDGQNLTSVFLGETKGLTAKYFEGTYVNQYLNSYLIFTVTSYLSANTTHVIVVDRSNELRKTCTVNSTWVTSVAPLGKTSGVSGYLDYIESFPKRCFFYHTSLHFSVGLNQFPSDVNISFFTPMTILSGTDVIIHLPGFSRAPPNLPLDPALTVSTSVTGNANPSNIINVPRTSAPYTVLYNLTWSSNYSWTARWYEGSATSYWSDSYIQLIAHGLETTVAVTWINVPKDGNALTPICGLPTNATSLLINMNNSYFYTTRQAVSQSNPIGFQCNCNGNGHCNYCTRQCECNDGFGSVYDRYYSITDDFQPDCSSRACPTGIAIGNLFSFDNASAFDLQVKNISYLNLYAKNAHRVLECSNNGVCNRQTGRCKCNEGFTGDACEHMKCPGTPTCSGRGRCYSMSRLQRQSSVAPLTKVNYPYEYTYMKMRSWDADFGHLCVCDSSWSVGLGPGERQLSEYFGLGCQFRHCPSGDNPDTPVIETNCTGISQTGGTDVGEAGNLCQVDCSNRGLCDYSSGVCNCFSGYGGDNCSIKI